MFQLTGTQTKISKAAGWACLAVAAWALLGAPVASAQATKKTKATATAKRPASCGQAANFYQLNPVSARLASDLAKCLKAANREEEAAAIFQKTAEKKGGPPEAWKYAAEVYDSLGRFSDAEAAYLKYFQSRPKDLEARLNLGRLYSGKGAFDKALEQYRLVLAAKAEYPPALAATARVFSWQGRHEESLQLYERALRVNPKDMEAATGKAFALLWMGRPEEAQALFSKLQQQYPKDEAIARGLSQAQAVVEEKKVAEARRTGSVTQLEAYHRRRLAENPNDLTALRALADLIASPQRCQETVGLRHKALELFRTDPALELELARTQADCNQLEEAIGHFRRIAELQPKNDAVLYELGSALRRAGRLSEAMELFRSALRLNPRNVDARLGLALALAVSGNHQEALVRFDEVLAAVPQNYEALQGKARVLFWMGQMAQARTIFQSLAARNPTDGQNAEALEQIAAAEEEARWAAIRPRPDAPPAEWLKYYQKRLESHPNDLAAMKGVGRTQGELRNLPAAIQAYQKVLAAYPDDRESKTELARFLSWDGQLEASIRLYRELLQATPDDIETLESLARVYIWSNRPQEALQTYQTLLGKNPSNLTYQLEMARLQLRMKDSPAAREFLTAVLSADPKNREATLLLAQMNLNQGQYETSIKQFDQVLKQNPKDPAALLGKARAYYYQGDVEHAYEATTALVKVQPKDTDALFLLASLERARRNRGTALALLDETIKLNPNHTEAAAMKKSILEAGTVTLQTTASYVREIGKGPLIGEDRLLDEDLRAFTYGTTLGFAVIPRTDSYFSMTFMPSNTPVGFFRGAVGPSQFFYRQTTQLTRKLTVRGGAGLVRFGPGEPVNFPGQPVPIASAELSPMALVGLNFAAHKRVRLDLAFSRGGITYTPTSVHMGVIENRVSGSAAFFLTPRTQLFLDYYYGRFGTREYDHIVILGNQQIVGRRADHDNVHRGSLLLNRNVYRSTRFSFDAGYSAMGSGNPGSNVFLGFFNPGLTQYHLFNGRIYGKLVGPLSFDFTGAIGGQQTDDEPWRRGMQLSPSFTIRVSRLMSFTVGYTYYDTSHTLSTLRGNAVYLTTDWRF